MSTDEFTRLFTYMQQEFSSINTKLENTASKELVYSLINTLDGFATLMSDNSQEIAMLAHGMQRMERKITHITGHTCTDQCVITAN